MLLFKVKGRPQFTRIQTIEFQEFVAIRVIQCCSLSRPAGVEASSNRVGYFIERPRRGKPAVSDAIDELFENLSRTSISLKMD